MINTDLEPMADLAEDIAERVSPSQPPLLPIPDELAMTDLTASMVRQSLVAHELDTHGATVCRLDDEVDRHNNDIIQELIQVMRSHYGRAGAVVVLGYRHLERIADHHQHRRE